MQKMNGIVETIDITMELMNKVTLLQLNGKGVTPCP